MGAMGVIPPDALESGKQKILVVDDDPENLPDTVALSSVADWARGEQPA